jgi:hypothetical protein
MRVVALVLPCFCIALGALVLDSKEAEAQSYTVVDHAIDVTWDPVAAPTAHVIADRESGDNPYAVNPYSGACGAFQFMPSTAWSMGYSCYELFDPYTAAAAAYDLYLQAGWSPWAATVY